MNGSPGDVDGDDVALFDQSDGATGGRLRRNVTDREPAGAAGEAAVREQRALFPEAFALEVRGRVEHFLHARAALGDLRR